MCGFISCATPKMLAAVRSPIQTGDAWFIFQKKWTKLCLGNKIPTESVWIVNGQETRSTALEEQDKLARFEQSIMPHMNAAYNLARWLAGNEPDAQDVVQEAYLRAFKFLAGFRGGDTRSWLLPIVRNSFYDWLKRNRREETRTEFAQEPPGRPAETASP